MSWRNTDRRYGWVAIGLHWLMLLLVAAVFACIELSEAFPKGSPWREDMKSWHFSLGLSVLGLGAFRVGLHFLDPAPRIHPPPPRWQTLLAKAIHLALLALMVLMPFLGWLALSAEGEPIRFLGWDLPALIGQGEDAADWAEDLHEAGGTLGYLLIGIHAAGALFHHYGVRDDTLRRMLPRRD